MTKKEVYNINFLKFVFAICICLWHVFAGLSSVDYFKLIPLYVPDAGILTNYYFIISGFFLYSSVVKENNTVAFVKNKIVRLWGPVFFFSTAMLILSSYNICNWNFNDFITCLFFINNIGFTEKYGAVAWFVSDLFFASLFYYFILKIVNHDLFKKVLWIALILIGSYIYI